MAASSSVTWCNENCWTGNQKSALLFSSHVTFKKSFNLPESLSHLWNALPFDNVCRTNEGIKVIFPVRQSTCQNFTIYDNWRICVWWGERRAIRDWGMENSNCVFFAKCIQRKFLLYSRAQDPFCPKRRNQRFPKCTDSTETVVLHNQISTPNAISIIHLEIWFLPSENSQHTLTCVG